MANIDSAVLNKNQYMQGFGNTVVADGTVALATNPVAADLIRVMKVQAGTKLNALLLGNARIDTNAAPTLVVSIGYVPVVVGDGPAANATYFQAAGDPVLGLATLNTGKLYCNFAPITFAFDVYITMTVGATALTFAAGSLFMAAMGEARGIK